MTWTVERHGGANFHEWRVLYKGDDRLEAYRVYEDAYQKMSQGILRLANSEGEVTRIQAPRLRTWW